MTFSQSVKICLGPKYFFFFKGRASRSEFWWFACFCFLTEMAVIFLDAILPAIFAVILSIATPLLLLPAHAGVAVRRFHDRNLSGWWVLACWLASPLLMTGRLSLASLAISIAYVVVACLPGQFLPNKYGPPPAEDLKN